MAGKEKTPVRHVLMRLSRSVRCSGSRIDILQEHNDIVRKHGSVGLAKHGRRISSKCMKLLKDQLESGRKTYLILVFRNGKKFDGFVAPISEIIDDKHQNAAVVPAYYNSLTEFYPTCWFILSSVFRPVKLADITMVKDGRPVVDVMSECRTSLMFVKADKLRIGRTA